MKNFVLTFLLFFTIITTIAILAISNLTSEDSTKKIIDNIDYAPIVQDFKDTEYGNYIYEFANNHDITENRIDSLLQTEDAKNYSNKLVQQIINAYLANTEINISDETQEFINTVNEKYNFNLDDSSKTELENYVNTVVTDNLNIMVNDLKVNTVNNNTSFIMNLINFCRNSTLHMALYIMNGILLLILFISSFKKKDFLKYIGIIAVIIAISMLLFNGVIYLLTNNVTSSLIDLGIILLPITDNFYMISIWCFIIAVIAFIIQYLINKHIINKEIVPF